MSVHCEGPRAPIRLVKWELNGVRACRAIDILLYVAEPLRNILKTHIVVVEPNHFHFGSYFTAKKKKNKENLMAKLGKYLEKDIFFTLLYNPLVLCMTNHRDVMQHYPLILLPALYSRRIEFWGWEFWTEGTDFWVIHSVSLKPR